MRRFSLFHLPSLSDFALVFFQLDLQNYTIINIDVEGQYIISFGVGGDVTCEALYLTETQIEDSLIEISSFFLPNEYNDYNNRPNNTQMRNVVGNNDTQGFVNILGDILTYSIDDNHRFSLFSFTRWRDNNINKIIM